MARWLDKSTFFPLALLVLLSPIPLASNRDWSWSLLAFLTAALVLTWLLATLLSRRRLFTGLHPLIPLLFLLALALGLAAGTTLDAGCLETPGVGTGVLGTWYAVAGGHFGSARGQLHGPHAPA